MKFPTRYEPNPSGLDFGSFVSGASATKQEFKDECDINSIMKRYISTGMVPSNVRTGAYGDFSDVGEYRDCLDTLETARSQFMSLSSTIRRRFDNDPLKFLEFIRSPGNLDEARSMGLLKEEPKAPPVVAEPTK